MDSTDIKKSQAKAISNDLFPIINYLFRLKKRMEDLGFPPRQVLFVGHAMHRLRVEVHYLSCDGVGRLPKNDEPEEKTVAKPDDTS